MTEVVLDLPFVREAGFDEMDQLLAWAEAFHDQSPWAGTRFDRDTVWDVMARLMTSPRGVVLTDGEGMLGAMLNPLLFDQKTFVAHECFFYSESSGQALFEAFEAWALTSGANHIQFTMLANEREAAARRLMESRGYQAKEINFFKPLRKV